MKTMMLTIAMMGFVFAGSAQNKNAGHKVVQHKTSTAKPVFTYKRNGVPVTSPASVKDNSTLISFSSEGTYVAYYPKASKGIASK